MGSREGPTGVIVPPEAIEVVGTPAAAIEVSASKRNTNDVHVVVNDTTPQNPAKISIGSVGEAVVHLRSNDTHLDIEELTIVGGVSLSFERTATVHTLRLEHRNSDLPVTFEAAVEDTATVEDGEEWVKPHVVVLDAKAPVTNVADPNARLPSANSQLLLRLKNSRYELPTRTSDDVSLTVELDSGAHVLLNRHSDDRFMPSYNFVGGGVISVKSDAERVVLEEREGQSPRVEVGKRVSLKAAGAARFTLRDGAKLDGQDQYGVGVQELRLADNAELRRVRLFDLPLSDLSNLRRAARIEPWWHAKANARNPNLMLTLDKINEQIPESPLRRSLAWRVWHPSTWTWKETVKEEWSKLQTIVGSPGEDRWQRLRKWFSAVTRWADPDRSSTCEEVAGRWQGVSEAVRLRGTSGRDAVWAAFIGQEMRRITAAGRAERLLLHVSMMLGHGCIIQRAFLWLLAVVTVATGWLGKASGTAKPFFFGFDVSSDATAVGIQLWTEILMFPILSIRGGSVPSHTQHAIDLAGLDGQLVFLLAALASLACWVSMAVAIGRLLRTQRTAASVTG